MVRHRLPPLWLRVAVLALIAAVLLIAKQFYGFTLVVGTSMMPTLYPRELCLVERVRDYQPQRGDIISFRTADDPPLWFVKRVVGLPGETVALSNGVPLINGQPLPEPYTQQNPNWNLDPITLGPEQIWVLSDHRRGGYEDYVQGVVATRLVRGRIVRHWRGWWARAPA